MLQNVNRMWTKSIASSIGKDKILNECPSKPQYFKIVGGNKTLEGEFPFSVLLGYRSKVYRGTLPGGRKVYRDEDTWICSGVILNSRFILTAAHCKISNQRKYRVRVGVHRVDGYIGSYDSGHSGEDGNIQDFTINDDNFLAHPQYVRRRRSRGQLEVRNDIGLIKLPSDVEFSLRSQPACWRHSSSVSDGHGQCAVVVGWGKTDPDQISRLGGVFSSDQIKLTLPLVPLQACQQHYPGVDSGQLCAGGVRGQDSCGGDSGGGLFSTMEDGSWQVIGIVSYGSRACGDGIPGIYTNVSYYKDWIKDNMENL